MSMIKVLIVMFFSFSILYTFFYAYADGNITTSGLSDTQNSNVEGDDTWITGITAGLLDDLLELASTINPVWILIKYILVEVSPYPLYFWLNMLILRPVGWMVSVLTVEWVINKFRGVS